MLINIAITAVITSGQAIVSEVKPSNDDFSEDNDNEDDLNNGVHMNWYNFAGVSSRT